MANKQETLIYIEKENHSEAEFMSRNFVNKELKNRAYLNALGAELVTKYLTSEGIKFTNVHNLHSMSKVLENVDISDILLPNIHIDVRVVFDENQIFIPKSHFELELVPDVYVVLKLHEEFKHVELLGYFKPSQINKENANKEYYFFDKNKLSSPNSLTKFVKDFTGKTSRDISEEDMLRGRELSIALADHNLSVAEEKELLELLLLSNTLRESILEFDNFETLSYSTAPVLSESLLVAEVIEEPVDEVSGEIEEPAQLEEVSLASMAMDEELDIDSTFTEEELLEDEEDAKFEITSIDENVDEDLDEEDSISDFDEDNLEDDEFSEETLDEDSELDLVDASLDILEEQSDEEPTPEEIETVDNLETDIEVEELVVTDEQEYVDTEEVVEEPQAEQNLELPEETEEVAEFLIDEPSLEEELVIDEEPIVEDIQEEVTEEVIETQTEELEVVEETISLEQEETVELEDAVETVEFELESPDVEEPSFEPLEEMAEFETLEPVENVVEEVVEEVQELNEMPEELPTLEENVEEVASIDENLPTLNIDETPALEIDPTDLGDDLLGGELVDENGEITTPEIEQVVEEKLEEEALEIEEPLLTPDEPYTPDSLENLSVDSILDQTIASISTEEVEEKEELEKVEEKETQIEGLDVAAAATATALAGAVAKAEAEAEAAVSDEAIKLASVSGDMINDIIQNLEEDQQKSLDKIDYAKTDITTEIDAPDHMLAATEDLSFTKMDLNIEAELSGEFGGPTDLGNLDEVEIFEEKEFVQESVDFGSMETISEEQLMEQGTENLNLGNLSDINIDMSAGANLPELNATNTTEEGVVDIPGFSAGGFTINEDGTSPLDAMVDNMSLGIEEQKQDDGLMDMDENSLDFSSCMKPSTRKRETSSYDNKPKPTIDEETKQALLANNIIKSSDDDDSYDSEDFGEVINLDEEEPFVIDDEETPENTPEATAQEVDLSELLDEELAVEDFPVEDFATEDEVAEEPAAEITEETISAEEFSLDDLDTMNEETTEDAPLSTEELSLDDFETMSEEPSVEVSEIMPQTEIQPEQQDWMEDTDYTNLEDVEIQPQETIEDFITEPNAEDKVYAVKENSTVISDKTFQAGEIHIDVNAQNTPAMEEDESLASLYNPNSRIPGGALLQTPGRMSGPANQGNAARGLLTIVGTLIVLALVGGIGFGVSKFFKAPTEEAPQPITDEPLPTSSDNGVTEANTLKINPDNVVNMDNNTNALATTTKKPTKQVKQQTPAATSASTSQKKGTAKAFVDIEKVTWSLPSYVTYSPQFKQYFQSAGKSLKLALTSDLLLATDYIYSSNMRVGIIFGKDGTFQSAQIVTSSGSNQIDKIVLQTVNQVLKALKAPNSVGNEENTPVTLNIYF